MTTNDTNDDVQFVPESDSDARRVNNDLDDSVVSEENSSETIKKLRAELKKAQEEKQEYLTGWQKAKADFINSRKRDEEAQKEFTRFANEGIIAELIPVLDSFNMAMGNKETWEKVDKNWRIGIEYISSQLKKVLEDFGLKEIDPLGKKFDPARDEAIEDAKDSDIVTTVVQKGYELNSKVLKAPKVKIGEKK